ncbi:MAG: S41 family peptidase [Cyclobacteriaceae bacterium]|nr:S41 family peptidase [Cyclobacteriaceae bacterium]
MKKLVYILFALNAGIASAQPLLLQPAISPDGNRVAFSYQGDIWTVPVSGGRADRLTLHEGYESMPVWSPDGALIAFTSDRFGNEDVFFMESGGGQPRQLTFHAAQDRVASFTPKGTILFTTRRLYAQVEREWEIYEVKTDGSTPVRRMDALGFDPAVSPDGSKIAFVRGSCRMEREAYRGPANRDVWIWDIATDTYTQLTDFEGNDVSPQWLNNETLLYLSSKSGKYNLHQIKLDKTDVQRTSETLFGVFSFSVSPQSGRVVYQAGDQVRVLDLQNGDNRLLDVNVESDFRFDPVVSRTVQNEVGQYAISPNGNYMAYVHRGEIFVKRNDKEDSRSVRITNGPARERDVTWLSDEALLFVSDQNGQNDLYMARSADPGEPYLFNSLKHAIRPVQQTKEEEFDPVVSPDGKKLAFRRGRGQLLTARISSEGNLTEIKTLLDGWDTPGGISWSPDSRWLAYSLSDLYFNEEVYIHAADNSKAPVNVSMHPKSDSRPVWSPDGSKLGFISQRNNGDGDVWFAWLQKDDWEKSREAWKRESLTKGDEEKDKKEITVSIDFENIYQRLVQVTGFAGNESEFVFSADGAFVYYAVGAPGRQDYKTEKNLYKMKWDGTENKEIVTGNKSPRSLTLSSKGDFLYALTDGGKVVQVKTKDDKSESLAVTSRFSVRYEEERDQLFEEGWRALRDGFYDPGFHGRDWEELKTHYKPLAMKASTKEDFQYVFNLMLGQLNASHMGMYRGENQKETQTILTGEIGVEGKNTPAGFEITRVVAKGPADRNESRLRPGDVVKAVGQQPVTGQTNFYSLFTGQIDVPVLLLVKRKGGTEEEVVIWPVRSVSDQLYDEWVEDRRTLVHEYSGGKLGYLHIRGMNWESFERFERELTAAGYGKEGIVIDVRYNGGGWTTDYLMTVLNVRQHAYTVPRGAAGNLEAEHRGFEDTYPYGERLPLASWTKPSVALCNESSYSNAEIFSHAYKSLGLGTLVGKATFGAVISTGSWNLVDGSYVRMPFRAWYVKPTYQNMEHGPAVPDVVVENPPAYKMTGQDLQLKKSVDILLEQIQ